MNIYSDGSIVSITLPYVDENGTELTVTAATYRVLDQDDVELVAETALAGLDVADIVIPAIHNTLSGGIRTIRTIELTMVTDAGTFTTGTRYVVESTQVLIVGGTSFQTYNESVLSGMDIFGLDNWSQASDRDRKKALIEAYYSIVAMTFTIGDISLYDEANILALESELLIALRKAQVAEANSVLGGNSIEDKRRIGLMSETIGESSNMFRPGKPLILPVSNAAMTYLSKYVSWSVKVNRG